MSRTSPLTALFFCFAMACSLTVNAQNGSGNKPKRVRPSLYEKFTTVPADGSRVIEHFMGISFTGEQLITSQTAGRVYASFPYSIFDPSSNSDHAFSGSGVNPLHKPQANFGADLQFGKRELFADLSAGAGTTNSFWSVGIGRALLFRDAVTRIFYLKGVLAISHYKLATNLGTFNTDGDWVYAMGEAFDPTFTRDGSTQDMQFIRVGYAEIVWAAHPKLSAEWHPFNSGFFVELNVGYLLPFSESGKLELRAASDDSDDTERKVSLRYPGTSTSFGSQSFTSSPFSLHAVQVGVRIGVMVRSFRVAAQSNQAKAN